MQSDQRRGASETGTIPTARVRHKERLGPLGGCSQPRLIEAYSYAPGTFKADQSFGLPTCESTSIAAART